MLSSPQAAQALYGATAIRPPCRYAFCSFRARWAAARTARQARPGRAQVRLAFNNLNAVLHAAGCTFDDVVDVTCSWSAGELRDRVGVVPGSGAWRPHADGHQGDLAVRLGSRSR